MPKGGTAKVLLTTIVSVCCVQDPHFEGVLCSLIEQSDSAQNTESK